MNRSTDINYAAAILAVVSSKMVFPDRAIATITGEAQPNEPVETELLEFIGDLRAQKLTWTEVGEIIGAKKGTACNNYVRFVKRGRKPACLGNPVSRNVPTATKAAQS